MQSTEIRKRFLEFFEKRGHKVIPSASLVPENDPSVLFTTAGMHPLVPYLLGEKHPAGKRLVNVQKCVRTQDIDEVGDNTHDTFFEMLGNWSLGDYFKEDAIKWSYEFLTSKKEGLGLDPKRLYITCFEGDSNAPRDDESKKIWIGLGIPEKRIYFMSAKSNWWQAGESGPCGPDTEMFYDITEKGLDDMTKEEYMKADDRQDVVEIWNDVFMEYLKKDGKVVGKLKAKNVDTGAGLERLCMVLQDVDNVFSTDLFAPIMEKINNLTTSNVVNIVKSKRIVADHIRTAVFMIADGVTPSNTDRGYVLRRLIRRAVRFGNVLGITQNAYSEIVATVIEKYSPVYASVLQNTSIVKEEFLKEADKFKATLAKGLKEFEKFTDKTISGKDAFMLFSSYGFPIEVTVELAKESGRTVDVKEFGNEFKTHQDLSRVGAEKKFKGGLADMSEKTIQYHTATHLLNAALRHVLGGHVGQRGSNITPERLRFDFTHGTKMTEGEKKKVEDFVNEKINVSLPVTVKEMPIKEAEKIAIHAFGEKYGDVVKVYSIGDEKTGYISREFCGGPHVTNTADIRGTFKIQKEEAVSAGVRRIKAVSE